MRSQRSVSDWVAAITSGDRAALGQAITLVESTRRDDRATARAVLAALSPRPALRIGISGSPGVGKSTLIEALGKLLTDSGKKVGVLAIDPSSERTGGSILGDKTRMPRLATDPRAFVRPSPSGGALGGVAARTREAMVVLEAAGHDVIIVETVGVGQSETAVRHLTDTFVLLALWGAGDELQGIKRGIMEAADVVLVTKADADPSATLRAATQLRGALRLLPRDDGWTTPVLAVSALSGEGMVAAWQAIAQHHGQIADLASRRGAQAVVAFRRLLGEALMAAARARVDVDACERDVREGRVAEDAAVDDILARLGVGPGDGIARDRALG